MAWTFTSNGSVISGLQGADGSDECLQVSSKDERTIVVGPCVGAKREKWAIHGTEIRSAFGGCIDNHATQPANPMYLPTQQVFVYCRSSNSRPIKRLIRRNRYGPLVVAPCDDTSGCSGQDHVWRWNSLTKQLVSAVPGMGEEICIESQSYGNHYATL